MIQNGRISTEELLVSPLTFAGVEEHFATRIIDSAVEDVAVRASGRLIGEDQYVGRHPAWRDTALTATAKPIVKCGALDRLPHLVGPIISRSTSIAHIRHSADGSQWALADGFGRVICV